MTIGRPPQQGQGIGMPDFVWLNGLAGGNNLWTQSVSALNAASQATAPVIGAPNAQGIEATLISVDASVANGSLQLPQAIAGKEIAILNTTANAVNVYANINVNKATGALDVVQGVPNANLINLAASPATLFFFCPKNGVWGQK